MKTKRFLLAVTVVGGLFTETNPAFAQTWTQTGAPITNWTSIASSADGRKLFATANGSFPDFAGGIYISTNSGATWMPTGAPWTDWWSVASSADGNKLVAMAGYPTNAIYFSTNSGATWSPTDGPSGSGLRVASSADGTRLVVARVGGYGVFGSTNSGATWTQLPVGGSCIASSADGIKLVAAFFTYNGFANGCVCTSTNSGETWTPTSAPVIGWTSVASSASGNTLVATPGGTDFPTPGGPIYVSTNVGGTWTPTSTPSFSWNSVACSADGSKLVAVANGGIYTSADSGVNWTSNSVPMANWSRVASSADGGKLVVTVGEYPAGGIYTSQSTPTPSLNITHSGGYLVVSWIVPSLEFVLQENSDLSTTNWADVTNQPTLNLTNLKNEVVVPPMHGSRFYRLNLKKG